MLAPLVAIEITSIYKRRGNAINLPKRMARCAPDTKTAVLAIHQDLAAQGGALVLSDMFRSYDMQSDAHAKWKSGRKKAYSPPPGGSMHEAGRAIDLDLSRINIGLDKFWIIASRHGFHPIIANPNSRASEAWHFDCRGSHGHVYDYYKTLRRRNMKPYKAMAASAILALGIRVDQFRSRQKQAFIQSGLVRLKQKIGVIDGAIGDNTNRGLATLGLQTVGSVDELVKRVNQLLRRKFPSEY